MAPPAGRGHGPMRECPGRIGPGARGPIGPSRPNLGETLKGASRREGGNLPPTPPSLATGLGLGEGLGLAPTPLYKEGWGRTLHTPPPQALAALLPSSLSPSR